MRTIVGYYDDYSYFLSKGSILFRGSSRDALKPPFLFCSTYNNATKYGSYITEIEITKDVKLLPLSNKYCLDHFVEKLKIDTKKFDNEIDYILSQYNTNIKKELHIDKYVQSDKKRELYFYLKIIAGYGNKNLQKLYFNRPYNSIEEIPSPYGKTKFGDKENELYRRTNLDYEYNLVKLLKEHSDYKGWYAEKQKFNDSKNNESEEVFFYNDSSLYKVLRVVDELVKKKKYYRIDYPGLSQVVNKIYFTTDLELAFNSFKKRFRKGFYGIPVLYMYESDIEQKEIDKDVYFINYTNKTLYYSPIILCYDFILYVSKNFKYINDTHIIEIEGYKNSSVVTDTKLPDLLIYGTTIKEDMEESAEDFLKLYGNLGEYTNNEMLFNIMNMYGIDDNAFRRTHSRGMTLYKILSEIRKGKIDTNSLNKYLNTDQIIYFIEKDIRCAFGTYNKENKDQLLNVIDEIIRTFVENSIQTNDIHEQTHKDSSTLL